MTDPIGSGGGRTHRRRMKANAFTVEKRQRFLDALALTCNVKMSADAAGVDHTTAYYHRVRDPVFADQWREALDVGCDRLETLLLQHGGAGEPLDPADAERAADGGMGAPFDFDKALKALHYYRSKKPLRAPQHAGRKATRETALAAVEKAIAAAERRNARRNGDAQG